MTIAEAMEMARKQYEEVDSLKRQKERKLSEKDLELLKKARDEAKKQIKILAEFADNYEKVKDGTFSASERAERKRKEEEKSDSRSSSSGSSKSSYYGSRDSNRDSSNFFESLDNELSEQINFMFERMARKHLDSSDDSNEEEQYWDALEMQLNYNRKNRKRQRYYEETEEDIKNKKAISKVAKKCERKIAIVEIVNFFKIDVYNKSSKEKRYR